MMTYWLANLGPIHLLTQKCLCQIWVEIINSLDTSVFQQSSIVATLPRTVTTELTNTGTDWCLDYSLYILRFIKCIIWAENRFLYRYALSIGMGKALFFFSIYLKSCWQNYMKIYFQLGDSGSVFFILREEAVWKWYQGSVWGMKIMYDSKRGAF